MTDSNGAHAEPDPLQQWRDAEQLAAVARHGRLAAETAAVAAEQAAEASKETATTARAALESSKLAEASATKTASAARLMVEAARVDSADSIAASALADVEETAAHDRYREAVDRAEKR